MNRQQWFELIALSNSGSDFGADFGADFGTISTQYTEQQPQVVIVDGCWIQRESPSSNQR